jgi:periplasmic copper chaperone A
MRLRWFFFILAVCGMPAPVIAAAMPETMVVTNPWSRVTASAGSAAVVYLTLRDNGLPDRLTAVSTPVAAHADLHVSRLVNGIMEMDPAGPLPLKPGVPLSFSPDGYHIMLTGLTHALAAGEHFPLTLRFVHAAPLTVTVTVQPMSYMPPSDSGMGAMAGMKMN